MGLRIANATCGAASVCGQRHTVCWMDARGRTLCRECWIALHGMDPS